MSDLGLRAGDRVLVTGGTGLIGTNLRERLEADGHEVLAPGSSCDLRDGAAARALFADYKPTFVFHLAAKVGGIYANNNYKADFYSDNVLINTHVIDASVKSGVRYVFAMGTGCAYPKRLEGELLREDDFLDGIPEPTNDAYAYAKRGLLVHLKALEEAGKMQFCYCIPANIYGAHDNFHATNSHVVPGLVRRFCEAVATGAGRVGIWGDGSAQRDFLYIGDCVDAIMLLAQRAFSGPVNVARGELTSIRTLADTISAATGFGGEICYDASNLTGQRLRIMDTGRMDALGWKPRISLDEGIRATVAWFRENRGRIRER